ncbi:MAG TPA: CotH kinase family protein, partial [Tepidisphaeraceae bacterium]|nr:CotH kinase family protein [Tepidisphaeraceae bacterium]
GQSSYMTVQQGRKRSLGVSLKLVNGDQRLGGYRSLNLLNSNGDPTFMRTALYHYVARQYIAAPKANWVRVVINGESRGIYVNTQQINSDLTKEWWKTTKGARWKVTGSPGGRGGLAYLGEDPAPYKPIYDIKSKDTKEAWADLIHLCKVLNQTPPAQLEKALEPILDVEGALKFLALDKASMNADGFWTRASDYSLYEDPDGKFHLIPWDANETFREPERMGRFGGGGEIPDDATLDIFAGANDPNKALLMRLLAVPALRARYAGYTKDIAQNWMDWKKMGPLVAQWQALIAADVKSDTRKIFSTEAFTKAVTQDGFEPGFGPTAPPSMSLKSFMDQRRAYLLK